LAWREWPLVAFTLLGQLATGVYLFFVLPAVFAARPAEGVGAKGPLLSVTAAVIAILAIAAAMSFFHLGRPFRAPKALFNLRTSWLSREILFELLFLIFLGVLFFLLWAGRGASGIAKAAAALAGLGSVLFIVSMIRIYMVPGVPAWNWAATPFSFLLATIMLGSLGGLTAGEVASRTSGSAAAGNILPGQSWFQVMAMIVTAFVVVGLVGDVLLAPNHGLLRLRAAASLKPPVDSSPWFFVVRLILMAGCGLSVLTALRSGPRWIWLAFGLAGTSGILARFEFYGLGGGQR
jgi:DMSO reductase anchor subunit